jgi:hypothetical protein
MYLYKDNHLNKEINNQTIKVIYGKSLLIIGEKKCMSASNEENTILMFMKNMNKARS